MLPAWLIALAARAARFGVSIGTSAGAWLKKVPTEVWLYLAAVLFTTWLATTCHADRQAAQQARANTAREQHIDSLTVFALAQQRLVMQLRAVNDSVTADAMAMASRYQALRASFASSGTDAVATLPTMPMPAATLTPSTASAAPLIQLVAQCDSTIPALQLALSGARALASIERDRADSLARANALKDERPPPAAHRCGWKCGGAIGATLATVVVKGVPLLIKHL